jgi:plastocyanin
MKKLVVPGLIGVIAVVGIVLVAAKPNQPANDAGNPGLSPSDQTREDASESAQTNTAQKPAATVQMFDDRFEPKTLTVKKGETVKFTNSGSKPRWPASNIHPSHEIYPEFDPRRSVEPGSSWEFRFDQAGTWRYHDHISPGISGTITVE